MVDHLSKLQEFTETHLFLRLLNKPSYTSTKLNLLSTTRLYEQLIETFQSVHHKPPTPTDLPSLTNKDSIDSKIEELRKKVNNSIKLKEDLLDAELANLKLLARLEFERGNYEQSRQILQEFRRDDRKEAWGELITSVLLGRHDEAKSMVEDLVSEVSDLKSKAWLLHIALFISFPQNPALFLELLSVPRFGNTVEIACPHLARYLVASTLLKKPWKTLEILQTYHKILSLDPGLSAFVEYFEDHNEEKAILALDKFSNIVKEDFFLADLEKELLKEAKKFFVFCKLQLNKSVESQWIEQVVGENTKKVLEELQSEYKASFNLVGASVSKVRKNY